MNSFKLIALLGILIIINQELMGTAQIPDYLIYKGDTLAIYTNPLESFFENEERPDSLFDKYGYNSTACWRGYIGYWELKNDSLFLLKLEGDSTKIDLSLIFKDRETGGKIFANWFNDSIYNLYGKLLHYVHMGYGSIYEKERVFNFSEGILTSINKYDNSPSRRSIYSKNRKLLANYIKTNTNHKLLPDHLDKARVIVQIDKVDLDGVIEKASVIRGINKELDNEALRVIKSIPQWDVLYLHGKPYNLRTRISVFFVRNKNSVK